jgi:hypothetical protein
MEAVEQHGLPDSAQTDRHDALAWAAVDRSPECDGVAVEQRVTADERRRLGSRARREWVFEWVDLASFRP